MNASRCGVVRDVRLDLHAERARALSPPVRPTPLVAAGAFDDDPPHAASRSGAAADGQERATAQVDSRRHAPILPRRRCGCPVGCSSRATALQVEVDVGAGRDAALGAARAAGHHEREGRLRARRASAVAARCWSTATPAVACVTPVARIAGREVTTVDGLPAAERGRARRRLRRDRRLAVRVLHARDRRAGRCAAGEGHGHAGRARPRARRAPLPVHRLADDRRGGRRDSDASPPAPRATSDAAAAAGRARRWRRHSGSAPTSRSGTAGFADDTAPRDALVAVPLPPGSDAPSVEAAGVQWVVAESLFEARELAGKVQGRRTTVDAAPPLALPAAARRRRAARDELGRARVPRARRVVVRAGRTSRRVRSPTAARSAARRRHPSTAAARELADRLGRAGARRLLARGRRAARPEAAAVRRRARCSADGDARASRASSPARSRTDATSRRRTTAGLRDRVTHRAHGRDRPADVDARRVPPVSRSCALLQEGALDAAGFDRAAHLVDERAAVGVPRQRRRRHPHEGAIAGARVVIDPRTGALERVEVRVAAGDPLDEVVLRSYAIGAAHMALGWVLTEGLAVDPGDRRGARPHDPLVRRHPGQGHAADRGDHRRRPRAAPRPARRTRCSPRSPRPRGTRWPGPRARGRRRFPARLTRTARMLRR